MTADIVDIFGTILAGVMGLLIFAIVSMLSLLAVAGILDVIACKRKRHPGKGPAERARRERFHD